MIFRMQAERLQTLQINILHIVRRRFQNDLILEVVLHAIWIFTIAPISWSSAGIGRGHFPGLRTKHSQERARTHGGSAFLNIESLHDGTTATAPKRIQRMNHLLERETTGHLAKPRDRGAVT